MEHTKQAQELARFYRKGIITAEELINALIDLDPAYKDEANLNELVEFE